MAQLIAALALTLLYGLVPGAAVLCLLRFAPRARLDALLATAAVSLTVSGTAVYLLLLLGVYSRLTAVALLLLPTLYLGALAWHRDPRLAALLKAPPPGAASASRLDRLALLVCGLLLLASFLDAASSPPTWWDGYITWDKWASDWGRRQHLHGYLFGYPQLLPMFSSLAYKLTGAFRESLPPATCGVHALHPLLGGLLLLALWRAAQLLRIPAWSVLVGVFGFAVVREHLTSGTADLMVTTLVTVAVTMYLASLPQPSVPATVVVGVVLFGAIAAKTTGAIATGCVLGLHIVHRRWPPSEACVPPLRSGLATLLAAVPALLNAPFYLQQLRAGQTLPLASLDPTEVNFRLSELPFALAQAGTSPAAQEPVLARLLIAWGVTAPFRGVMGVVLLALIVGACLHHRVRTLVPLVALHLLVWAVAFPYDLRNLLPSVPLLAITLAAGGQAWCDRMGGPAMCRRALALALGTAAIAPAIGLMGEFARRIDALGTTPTGLLQRLQAMDGDLGTRVRAFFPDYQDDYVFLRELDLRARGARLHSASPLYRWFPDAGYPLAWFWWGQLRPGDLYTSWPQHLAVYAPASWTLVRRDGRSGQHTWIYTPEARKLPLGSLLLTGVTPPHRLRTGADFIVVRFSGIQSVVACNALPHRPLPGSWLIWRLVAADSSTREAIRPFHLAYDPGIVDLRVSTLVAEGPAGHDGTVTYGGLLVLNDQPLSTRPEDGILVGIVSDQDGARLRIREFELTILPPAAPKPHAPRPE